MNKARERLVPLGKDDHRYEDLEDLTVSTLSALSVEDFLVHENAKFRYIGERVAAVRRQFGEREHRSTGLDDIAVIIALRRLVNNSVRILQGALTGEACISGTHGLWNRMMCDWPMGDYGCTLAAYINAHELAKGKVLELGAGVGHASRFVRISEGAVYVKTDINRSILRMYNRGGILEAFDIDSDDIPYENFDLVFASNVLHCAQDKAKTLNSICRMLGPGGQLVFSEGTPYVLPNREWCLSPLFGFLDGWWDRGGFIDWAHWSALVEGAGFSIVAREPMHCGRYILGNLIACRKETD